MTETGSYILADNLAMALKVAIDDQKKREAQAGFIGPSAFLFALQANLRYLQQNKTLEIRP